MKNKHIASVIGAVGISSFVGLTSISAQTAPVTPPAPPVAPPVPDMDPAEAKKISSYLLGYQHAQQLSQAGLTAGDVDTETLVQGFLASLKGDKPVYEQEKIQSAMQTVGKMIQDRQAKKAEENLAAGKAFLEKNGKREGVITTESGLQYEILNKGTDVKYVAPSAEPDMGTKFHVNYRGTLIDGTEFDKSPEGQPFPMALRVIDGFKEALTMMPVGSKWKLFIPSELAYGARPAGPKITPNSTLIFELELVKIEYAPAPKAAPAPPAAPKKPTASAVTPPVPVPAPPKPKKETAE